MRPPVGDAILRPPVTRNDPRVLAIALLLACGGCSSSILIRPDDGTFRAARQHLTSTAEVVARAAVSAEERALFLQAESFYRYRFQPPPRGTLTYLAQGAAAIADFPALQSLAGSLDLAELRLRMYDGSIQLWETLLAEYPQTRLRPLALYRLGWAYRSAGVTGLPRESGSDAFQALIREAPTTELAALARAAEASPWKSKSTATALSFLPGLGQFYVGERLNGTVRLVVALVATALVVAPTYVAYQRRQDLGWHRDWPLLAVGVGGLVVLSLDYTAAYQDALRGVVDYNERAEAAFEARHPHAP
jgi:hypothetical protein